MAETPEENVREPDAVAYARRNLGAATSSADSAVVQRAIAQRAIARDLLACYDKLHTRFETAGRERADKAEEFRAGVIWARDWMAEHTSQELREGRLWGDLRDYLTLPTCFCQTTQGLSFEGDPVTEAQSLELYYYLIATGLSDYEARGTAWPEPK